MAVDLTADANFSTFTSFNAGPLQTIATLVDNQNAVLGTFTGLAEGAAVDIGGGQTAFISYVGGDGNDIVLQTFSTIAVPEPSSPEVEGAYTVYECEIPISDELVIFEIDPSGVPGQTSFNLDECETIKSGNVHFDN